MCHNQFWLDDKKTLNDMRNMKMPSVLFKKNKANVYNRDNLFQPFLWQYLPEPWISLTLIEKNK